MADFKISAALSGHDDDVRGVSFPSPKALISASRDGTVRIWNLLSDNPPTYDNTISSHSSSFVNAVAYLPPTPQHPNGLIISGGKDVVIDVRDPSKKPEDNAEALLLGHSSNVCALNVDEGGKFIVSGSWDNDARVWPVGKWESDVILKGHQHSPWAVLAYDSDTILTGSGDKHIRVFSRSGKLINQFLGSDSPIRSLAKLPKDHPSGADFASAANDGIIRLWTLAGKRVAELRGHESFVYSLASLPSGELVSSGEDRTVKVWRGTECIQTITHPAISVWQVAVCQETGDIATGASDKIVRIFTRDPQRFANAETIKFFEDSVKESSIPQQQVGDFNKEKYPGPDFLTKKSGTKDGQNQLIREADGSITAHQWSAGQQQWVSIGTVVNSVGSSRDKVDYLGKKYDYVFDVDIQEGAPPLKLPFNLSQNPYEAATKFITDNELPISYLDQVADFITTNTRGQTIGDTAPVDTGPDAWGTENRYRPGDGDAPASLPPPPKALPQKDYLNILVARPPAIEKKIRELNQDLIKSGHKDVSLNPTELDTLSRLRQHIETSGATKSSQSVVGGLDLAVKLSTQWPYKDRLPGLDLLRLLAVAPQTATFSYPYRESSIIDVFDTGSTANDPPAENHIMMAVRGFANLFDSAEGRKLVVAEYNKIQNVVKPYIQTSTNRNLLVAAVTLYLNYAVCFRAAPDPDFEQAIDVLDTLIKIIGAQKDAEVVFRALVAIGTLLTVDAEIKSAAKDVYGVGAAIAKALERASDPRIKSLAGEIRDLLQ